MQLAKREVRAHKSAVTTIKDDALLLFLGNRADCYRHETDREVRAHKNVVTNIKDDFLYFFFREQG
jgi:hypothetical protein